MSKKSKINKDECDILKAEWDESQEQCAVKNEEQIFPDTFQSMNWGTLVKNPHYVMRAVVNGKKSKDFFGALSEVTTDHLGRVLSMEIRKGILPTDEFIKANNVQVELYAIKKDKTITKRVFKGKDLGIWDEL